jgi:hypothetical protein
MLPLLGALVGAGGSIAGGLIGAGAADTAAMTNWQINLLNYFQRERERKDAMREAASNKRDTKLGMTDARGNRVHFVEGVGWVTDLGEGQDEMQKLQDQEQRNVLTQDLPMRRRAMQRNEQRSLGEESLADMFRRNMLDVRRGSDASYEHDLMAAQTQGLEEAGRAGLDQAMRTAMRTGTSSSNIGRIAERHNAALMDAFRKAGLQAKVQSRGKADEEFERRRASEANLYNLFAGRAAQLPDVSYRPQPIDTNANANMSRGQAAMGSANQLATQVAAMKGGTLDYIQPNYGWANAIGGGASALASALRMAGTQGNGVRGFGSPSSGSSDQLHHSRFLDNELAA